MKPNTTIVDVATGEHTQREMTDEEYESLLASGWTEEPAEEQPE